MKFNKFTLGLAALGAESLRQAEIKKDPIIVDLGKAAGLPPEEIKMLLGKMNGGAQVLLVVPEGSTEAGMKTSLTDFIKAAGAAQVLAILEDRQPPVAMDAPALKELLGHAKKMNIPLPTEYQAPKKENQFKLARVKKSNMPKGAGARGATGSDPWIGR